MGGRLSSIFEPIDVQHFFTSVHRAAELKRVLDALFRFGEKRVLFHNRQSADPVLTNRWPQGLVTDKACLAGACYLWLPVKPIITTVHSGVHVVLAAGAPSCLGLGSIKSWCGLFPTSLS